MPYTSFMALLLFLLFQPVYVFAKEDLKTSSLAEAFGRQPMIKEIRISPDGSKIVYIRTHSEGITFALVIDVQTQKSHVVVKGKKDTYDIRKCDWANNHRLLCEVYLVENFQGRFLPVTRLVGVNDDGSNLKLLLKREQPFWSQFQSTIVDWLPEDPEHVWLEYSEGNGESVQELNIYSGRSSGIGKKSRDIWSWISDGSGNLRVYTKIDTKKFEWYVSTPEDDGWKLLRSHLMSDGYPSFDPLGFGEDRNKLYYFDNHKGKRGLFVIDLTNSAAVPERVYVRPEVDLANVYRLGKSNRIVGVSYQLDRSYHYFFDEQLMRVHSVLSAIFPDKSVRIVDEDWQKRHYVVHVSSDTDAGAYHLYDMEKNQIRLIARLYPLVDKMHLRKMEPLSYPGRDQTIIPGYLTLPPQGQAPFPMVVLPHGGPLDRDVIEFDFLVQYLAAKGFAVLQSNYRGSSGGTDWEGYGAFKQWRLATQDIVDGADYLIGQGVADKNRLCIVGWSYGGYAALMSAVEYPELFKCVGSIAGVTDPKDLADFSMRYVGGRAIREFIGMNDEVIIRGSPLRRTKEISQPVFLVHPYKDFAVPFRQGQRMAEALKKANKSYEFTEYRHADHNISPERYRIDMLTRMGDFIDRHIGAVKVD